MEAIEVIINKMRTHTQTSTSIHHYNCNKCKDVGYTKKNVNGYTQLVKCECEIKKEAKEMLEHSGLSEAYLSKRINDYKVTHEQQKQAKEMAIKYVKEFDNQSMGIFGQVGAGKTHLTVAVANALMTKNIPVRYAQYGEMINKLISAKKDSQNYIAEGCKYKNVKVLLIDDLFKGAITNWNGVKTINKMHVEIVFDVINYRYLNKKATIISCELIPQELLEIDEGIASRIMEMTKEFRTVFTEKKLNYRIFGE